MCRLAAGTPSLAPALVLGCAITFALNQLYAKQLITVLGSVFYTTISMVAGGIAAVLIHAVSDGDFGASSFFLWMALATAIFATVLPIFCINAGLAYTSAQTVGMISTISPLVTIGLAVTHIGRSLSPGPMRLARRSCWQAWAITPGPTCGRRPCHQPTFSPPCPTTPAGHR